MKIIQRLPVFLFVLVILSLMVVLHLLGLTKLAVFADEAIYIRWAQLIIDDPGRYFFFALNDGKTPLFIWQLVPFINSFKDPLFAGRLLSVIGGIAQVGAIVFLVRSLKGSKTSQIIVACLTAFLPFWYFHHQMALIDGWLTMWLTLSLASVVQQKRRVLWTVVGGLSLGAAFLTKLPAVLFFPAILFFPFFEDPKKQIAHKLFRVAMVLVIGVGVFGVLKISPAFPQLFFRGSDFLYPVGEVLQGKWTQTVQNIPTYIAYFWSYLTPGVLLLFMAGFSVKKLRLRLLVLLLGFLAFVLPISLLGKVVYPRYFLPASIFITVGAALAAGELLSVQLKKYQRVAAVTVAGLLITSVYFSAQFIFAGIKNADSIPFVPADRVQYLTEWSSGHGIYEVYQRLMRDSSDKTIAVATEGFFGTLPDGVLMYLHNENVTNLVVEGVGQPVEDLPQALINKQDSYDEQWLLVNSHRLKFDIESKFLIEEYCRPDGAPCLQLWNVTELVAQRTVK